MNTDYLNFCPGPSMVSGKVKNDIRKAMDENILSLSHRSEKFKKIYREAEMNLFKFLGVPQGYKIFFLSSATECMEAVARSCVSGSSLNFVSGSFSKRFADLCESAGNRVSRREVGKGRNFDLSKEKLDVKEAEEFVGLTYTETSTGASLDARELAVFRKRYKDAVIGVDIVSAAGAQKIDFRNADVWFFSVQKAFGLPAGLGVMIMSKRAIERAKKNEVQKRIAGSFRSITRLEELALKAQTYETPNVLNLYLLSKQAGRFARQGMDIVDKRTREKAEFLYTWAQKKGFEVFVKEKRYRSPAVACLLLPEGISASGLHDGLKKKSIEIGKGYKEMKETAIRIANFPAHTLADMKKLTREIERLI